MRGGTGAYNRYYYCQNHDPLRARGEHRRCPERNIRADALDAFVFEQLRTLLQRPDLLLAAEQAVTARTPAADDELLRAQLKRLERRVEGVGGERRRLVDLYQSGLLELAEVQDRVKEIDARRGALEKQRRALIEQRGVLAQQNLLRRRIAGFAHRVRGGLDELGFDQRQKLVRLMVEEVRVAGYHVDIRLRIPLDEPPDDGPPDALAPQPTGRARLVSTNDRLRSLDV